MMLAMVAVASSALPCRGQSTTYGGAREAWRIGAAAGFGLLEYKAEMKGLPGIPSCCPEYRRGTGDGISAGVFGEMTLARHLALGLRVQYARYDGSIVAQEQTLVTSERDTTTATFAHTITLAQPAFAAEAYVSYEILTRLDIQAGFRADLMSGGTFRQQEEIVTPATLRFENGSRRRLDYDGAIPCERSPHLAVTLGLRYNLPLNHRGTWVLSPEVGVWRGLGSLVDGATLGMSGVRFGLGLGFVILGYPDGPSPLDPGEKQ